jgi:hypothetical protein
VHATVRAFALGVSLGIALLPGCMRHEYVVSGTVPRQTKVFSAWQHNFFWGSVSATNPIDLRAVCPEGISRIESEISLEQTFMHALTLGIYGPTKMRVYCRKLPITEPPTPAMPPPGMPPPEMQQ